MDKTRIMVVEDEGIVALDIARQLTDMGYDVVATVYSGEEAVDKVGDLHPDLVLMDVMLAGAMDGIEAADIIRSRCDIPVVFLTAYADQALVERAKLVYPLGYVLKPFEYNALKIAVEMALYIAAVDREKRKAEEALKEAVTLLESRVRQRTIELQETNTALKVILAKGMQDHKKLRDDLQANINKLVIPLLARMRKSKTDLERWTFMNIMETNLANIFASVTNKTSVAYKNLTPKEMQVAEMIRDGKKSKEIAQHLGISVGTVLVHRNKIRRKLDLMSQKANLRSRLLSIGQH